MSALPRIQDFDDPTYNPFIADEAMFGDLRDPYTVIAQLRKQGTVIKGDYRGLLGVPQDITSKHLQHYCVLGYDEVGQVLNDPVRFSNKAYGFNLGVTFGRSISTMDAPEHTRYRRIFQKAFLPNIVSKWGETLVDPVIENLMDQFVPRGRADLVQEFTLHYPFQIIYRQLGLPQRDVKIFHKLAIAQTVVSFDYAHGTEASAKLGVYFKALLDERRAQPGGAEDLVSLLAFAEVEGERLPEEVVISFLRQLVNAGGDTTYRGTSVLLTGLLSNPEQLDAVRADRSLIPQAIEEALRWDGPVLVQTRMTAEDVTLGGVQIPAGCVVDVLAGAANHDPEKFPHPERFDILRPRGARHFAFASGPHICIGQHLARLEMTRALNAILDRLHNLRLDPEMPTPDIRGGMMRVPEHLYVRFDP